MISFIHWIKTTVFLVFPDIIDLLVETMQSSSSVCSFPQLLEVVSLRSDSVSLRKYIIYRHFRTPFGAGLMLSGCPAPGTRTPDRQHQPGTNQAPKSA